MRLKPVLKWVGGKRQLLEDILPRLPKSPELYVEPFVGGGAVLLAYQPKHAIVNDYNAELVNVYEVVRDNPDDLLDLLREHAANDTSEYFYAVRALDRDPDFVNMGKVERAARIIYLNKTCFSGLYRVNSAGQFNSSYGRRKHPDIVNEIGIRALSSYLAGDVQLACGDYAVALQNLPAGSFVYLDPPYMPLSETSDFTRYTAGGFPYSEQVRLRDECVRLRAQGIHFLQSNSDCEAIRELYADFDIATVQAERSINAKGGRRGPVNEVLISG